MFTSGLNMFWPYTPSSIGAYTIRFGLVGILMPAKKEAAQVKLNRVRINLCRYRKDNFPDKTDGIAMISGRAYATQYGWRWHGFSCAEEAREARAKITSDLFLPLQAEYPTTKPNVESLVGFWETKLGFPENPPFLHLTDKIWRKVCLLQAKHFLIRLALRQGLSPDSKYPLELWTQRPKREAIDLSRLAPLVQSLKQATSISDIIGGVFEPGDTPGLRRALYQLAYNNCFPEFDELRPQFFLEPKWDSQRWQRAFENSDDIKAVEVRIADPALMMEVAHNN